MTTLLLAVWDCACRWCQNNGFNSVSDLGYLLVNRSCWNCIGSGRCSHYHFAHHADRDRRCAVICGEDDTTRTEHWTLIISDEVSCCLPSEATKYYSIINIFSTRSWFALWILVFFDSFVEFTYTSPCSLRSWSPHSLIPRVGESFFLWGFNSLVSIGSLRGLWSGERVCSLSKAMQNNRMSSKTLLSKGAPDNSRRTNSRQTKLPNRS